MDIGSRKENASKKDRESVLIRSEPNRLIRCETIQQAVAAGALEFGLRAAAVGPARGMRRVPGFRDVVVAQADAVGMPDHRRALRRTRPVLAGAVVAGGKRRAVRLRSRQHVMPGRRVAETVDDIALLGERGLFGEAIAAVQFCDVLGDDGTLGVLPRTLADAIACVHRGLTVGGLGREVGTPGFGSTGARSLRQRLAIIVGAGETAKV